MMDAKSPSHCKERQILTVGEQHLRPASPGLPAHCATANRRQLRNILIAHRQFDRLPPSCHDANPRSPNRKRGIHQQAVSSKYAGFTESIV
jgi:hypothetical protein